MKATNLLTDEEKRRIDEKIVDVEEAHALEIVCACSTESGRYDRAESICGLICAVVCLCVAYYLAFGLQSDSGDWSVVHIHLGWQVLAVVVGFIVGSILASYVHGVRRLFVSDQMCAAEVERSAAHVVALARLSDARNRPAMLVYVSCFERRIVILVNERLNQVISQELIDQLCLDATAVLKQRQFANAFLNVIDRIAAELSKTEKPEVNIHADIGTKPGRLPNHMLIFHPRPN